jgi:hypothetical protein
MAVSAEPFSACGGTGLWLCCFEPAGFSSDFRLFVEVTGAAADLEFDLERVRDRIQDSILLSFTLATSSMGSSSSMEMD